MNYRARLLSLVGLILLLALSTLGAPVKSGDSPKTETPEKDKTEESTAKELEELSKTGNVVLPAAPVVAKVTENANAATGPEEQADDLEKESTPVSDVNEAIEEQASKRQFAGTRGLPASSRQLPALPTGLDDLSLYPRQPDVDLSPRAVAEYLLVTADFSGFDQVLDDLLNTGILSPSEIGQYKDNVSREYENLLQQVAQAESQYLQELSRVSPMDYFNTIQQPVRLYPEYPYNQNSLEYSDIDLDNYRDQMPSLMRYGDQVIPNYQQQQQQQQPEPEEPDYQERVDQELQDETLMDKERTLGDILSDMLNEYYNEQTQGRPDAEYDVDLPEDISSYALTDDDNSKEDTDVDSGDVDDEDAEIKQFMAYLQQTLTSEEAGAGIIEIPDKSDSEKPDKTEQIDGTGVDVANELDDLTRAETGGEDHHDDDKDNDGSNGSENEEQQHSGDVDAEEMAAGKSSL